MGSVRTLFSFSGRSARRGFVTILAAVLAVVAAAAFTFAATSTVQATAIDPTLPTILVWSGIAGLVWLVVAAAVRRLHDRDRSGAMVLIFVALPWALAGLGTLDRHGLGEAVADLLAIGLAAWGGVEMLLRPGTRGDNRHGADPLATTETPAAGGRDG